jgi:hypothetical protein
MRADEPIATNPSAPRDEHRLAVHIETSEVVILERRAPGTVEWEFACGAPCDRLLPGGDEYMLTGAGIRPTSPFHLRPTAIGTANIEVTVHNRWNARRGGPVLAGAGSLIDVIALTMVAAGAIECSTPGRSSETGCDLRTAGLVALIPGTLLLGSGAVLALQRERTDVRQVEPVPSAAGRAALDGGVEARGERLRGDLTPREALIVNVISGAF